MLYLDTVFFHYNIRKFVTFYRVFTGAHCSIKYACNLTVFHHNQKTPLSLSTFEVSTILRHRDKKNRSKRFLQSLKILARLLYCLILSYDLTTALSIQPGLNQTQLKVKRDIFKPNKTRISS